MKGADLKFRFRKDELWERVEFQICGEQPNGSLVYVKPVEFVIIPADDPKDARIPPMVSLKLDEVQPVLQSMMDELWRIGIRPQDIGTPGHLSATQNHLADMQRIAGKLLGVDLGGKP